MPPAFRIWRAIDRSPAVDAAEMKPALSPDRRLSQVLQRKLAARGWILGEIEHRIRREETIRVRERCVENLPDAAEYALFVYAVVLLQQVEQVIEESMPHEAIVDDAVALLERRLRVQRVSMGQARSIEPKATARSDIDPYVEIAVDDPARPEIGIDLQQGVLRMRFQEEATAAGKRAPAFDDGSEDLFQDERKRLGAQPLDDLAQERRVLRMSQIFCEEGESGIRNRPSTNGRGEASRTRKPQAFAPDPNVTPRTSGR